MIWLWVRLTHHRAGYYEFWWGRPSWNQIRGIWIMLHCRRCSGEGVMGAILCSVERWNCAIPNTPDPFHLLCKAIHQSTPQSWFPISVDRIPEWGRLPWPPPAPLVHCAHVRTGSPCIPPTGAGRDPLKSKYVLPQRAAIRCPMTTQEFIQFYQADRSGLGIVIPTYLTGRRLIPHVRTLVVAPCKIESRKEFCMASSTEHNASPMSGVSR